LQTSKHKSLEVELYGFASFQGPIFLNFVYCTIYSVSALLFARNTWVYLTMATKTNALLGVQWHNPTNISSVLSVIGGETIMKALAQLAGGRAFIAPVAFSFGWVAYAFNSLISVVGEGRLMPPPDFPAKVINVESGYTRENRTWVIGRLLRDFTGPLQDNIGLSITIFEAIPESEVGVAQHIDWIWWSGVAVIVLQLAIASIPCGLYGDWGVLLVTGAGICLALVTGILPQWHFEKWACRTRTKKVICITGGNGTRQAMIILGNDIGLDLEDLAAAESPRLRRRGETRGSRGRWSRKLRDESGSLQVHNDGHCKEEVVMIFGYPAAYLVTQLSCLALAVAWIFFLITVSGLTQDQWYLMAVGSIGMLQNVVAAGSRRSSAAHGINLREIETFENTKAMDTLMDLEDAYPKCGKALLHEYFPGGGLKDEEEDWWKGIDRKAYDALRRQSRADSFRVPPRTQSLPWLARRTYLERSRSKSFSSKVGSVPKGPEQSLSEVDIEKQPL
jgi:hypothetical protein